MEIIDQNAFTQVRHHLKAVIFDLDGTLIDSLPDIAEAANGALNDLGYPLHPLAQYRVFIGDGIRELFVRALPSEEVSDSVVSQAIERFKHHYHVLDHAGTTPYRGIQELLGALVEKQIALNVLSNKLDRFTKEIVTRVFPTVPFNSVLGERRGIPRKPDPAGAIEIVAASGYRAEEFWYLGDTAVDMKTARGAGLFPIGALWGYRLREELIEAGAALVVTDPEQLAELLLG